jgi:2-polyprenyl-6-methoxyphenol hydroxylase-like FAD-dependent oxidoreductase
LQCEQWRLAELLYARLKNNPLATIRLGQKAVGARQNVDGVERDVMLPDGGRTTVSGTFLVGADGIGSIIRSAIGALFDGITIPELFLTLCQRPTISARRCPILPTSPICRIHGMVRTDTDRTPLAGAVSSRCLAR